MSNRTVNLVVLALGSVAAAGCGPYMDYPVRDVRYFVADARCSQGPFEIRTNALGARWGEEFDLAAYSPRHLMGRYTVSVGGAEVASGTSERLRWVERSATTQDGASYYASESTYFEEPQNERCVATTEELQAGSPGEGGTAGAGGSGGASGTIGAEGGAVEAAAAPVVALREVEAPTPEGVWSPEARLSLGLGRYHIAGYSQFNEDLSRTAFEAGIEILFRFWSVEPNDLEGVTFVLEHRVAQPDCSDEEWAEQLAEERADREEESREQQEEDEEWSAYCDAHHDDEECWGEGGYDAYQASWQESFEESGTQAGTPPPVEPTGPQPSDPTGPPPAPRPEARSPSPSVNAEWVPGYWHWSGFAWGWIAGLWRVPEADIEADLTTHAPEQPPPPLIETRPASPASNALWTAGYWQWDGDAFVWVKGSWQIPPSPESEWRPADWRIDVSGAVFLPGAWTIRIGP